MHQIASLYIIELMKQKEALLRKERIDSNCLIGFVEESKFMWLFEMTDERTIIRKFKLYSTTITQTGWQVKAGFLRSSLFPSQNRSRYASHTTYVTSTTEPTQVWVKGLFNAFDEGFVVGCGAVASCRCRECAVFETLVTKLLQHFPFLGNQRIGQDRAINLPWAIVGPSTNELCWMMIQVVQPTHDSVTDEPECT
jgi:hypothetical protein